MNETPPEMVGFFRAYASFSAVCAFIPILIRMNTPYSTASHYKVTTHLATQRAKELPTTNDKQRVEKVQELIRKNTPNEKKTTTP